MKFTESDKVFGFDTKAKIEDFNWLEVYGFIIVMTNQVEIAMDGVITSYVKPGKAKLFKDIMLDSGVFTLSGKVIVLKAIINELGQDEIQRMLKEPKKTIGLIEDIITIRNRFAHKATFISSVEGSGETEISYESMYKILSRRSGKVSSGSAWDDVFKFESKVRTVSSRMLFWANQLDKGKG